MKYKHLFGIIVLALLVLLLPANNVHAATTKDGFTIKKGVLTKYNGSKTNVKIPKNVTKIGKKAFYKCNKIKQVTIPNGVTCIEKDAFYGCSKLQKVNLPNSLTTIQMGAFSHCKSLKSITIPKRVKNIGSFAFSHCKGLHKVKVSRGVKKIGEFAFAHCASLKRINLPTGLTHLDRCTFYNCKNLTTIHIPTTVTTFGSNVFDSTKWLLEQRRSSPFVIVNDILIDGRSCRKDIVIPDHVIAINNNAFERCPITNVTVSDSVQRIEKNAFLNCIRLETISLPSSITFMDDTAFYNYSSLKKFYVVKDSYSESYCKENNFPYSTGAKGLLFEDLPENLVTCSATINDSESANMTLSITNNSDSPIILNGSTYLMNGFHAVGMLYSNEISLLNETSEHIDEITIPANSTQSITFSDGYYDFDAPYLCSENSLFLLGITYNNVHYHLLTDEAGTTLILTHGMKIDDYISYLTAYGIATIKENLENPSSFNLLRLAYWKTNETTYSVQFDFSSTNSYGDTITNHAITFIPQSEPILSLLDGALKTLTPDMGMVSCFIGYETGDYSRKTMITDTNNIMDIADYLYQNSTYVHLY